MANAIFDAHRDDPEFGYRFLADEVRAAGWDASDRTVWRIFAANGWWCSFGKPRRNCKASAPATAAHNDLVRRDVSADGPNQIWVADITEHRTGEGKLYVCAIKDLWSNRIVGWAIDERMKARLVVAAIMMAVAQEMASNPDTAEPLSVAPSSSSSAEPPHMRCCGHHLSSANSGPARSTGP